MKRFVLPLLLLAANLACTAQSWCPPGAQWIYDMGSPWTAALAQFTYAGDTIVDGYPAQRIDRIHHMTFPVNQVWDWGPFFTRTNGDVVWEWNGAEWDTLYWFSALPGDSWQPFWFEWEDCPDHAWLVVDTSTTVVSGIPLRTQFVVLTELGEPTGTASRTIYERIGGGGGYGFPDLAPCGPIFECYCTFSCYQDQDIIPQGGPCALPLGLMEQAGPAAPTLQVYPNPARGPASTSMHATLRTSKAPLWKVQNLAMGSFP